MDDAAIDAHNLVDVLLGDRGLAESDNTGAHTIGIVDIVHLAQRREEGEDIFSRETGGVSTLNGESQFTRRSLKDGGQLSIKAGEKIGSCEERHS